MTHSRVPALADGGSGAARLLASERVPAELAAPGQAHGRDLGTELARVIYGYRATWQSVDAELYDLNGARTWYTQPARAGHTDA